MRYALFLGCTVPARARNYELSTRRVAEAFGIGVVDLEDFGCCGFPIKSVNRETTLLMAARTLAIAGSSGLNICTVCSACTGVLTEVSRELEHEDERAKVNEKLKSIGKEYKGGVKVKHILRILYEDIGLDRIKNSVKKDISGLRVAPHYGCHYLKPSEIYDHFDDPEDPKTLDELISAISATPVDYENKKQCCGGGILAMDERIALTMAGEKIDHISKESADCMTLICPFCAVMYDDNQKGISLQAGKEYNLPVLYYTQLIGLAMGMDPKRDLGLQFNKVKTKELLSKIGIE
ncbi:MAG: CoB--CoM heterodisulfide reductase iron-sulfur subunit B family protein [bacterium]|nr:CoB--CoM heterodisulfide reductase iron-sulfur subunit B family protein [bacterium]